MFCVQVLPRHSVICVVNVDRSRRVFIPVRGPRVGVQTPPLPSVIPGEQQELSRCQDFSQVPLGATPGEDVVEEVVAQRQRAPTEKHQSA